MLCRTGSRPFCSTNGNTVSPLEPKHSWPLACLGRSHLLLLMLLGLLLIKHIKANNDDTVYLKTLKYCMKKHFLILVVHLLKAKVVLHSGIRYSKHLHCFFLYLVLQLDSSGFHSSVWPLALGQSCSCGPWLPAPLPGNT